jgi:hypothetical protein
VSKLKRVAIGPISDPDMTPGMWRELTKQEVKLLETGREPRRRATRPAQTRKKPATAKKAAAKKPATPRRKTKTKSDTRRSAARRG